MSRRHPFRDAVLQIIRQHQLLQAQDHVLVAVSGGADSLALLHVLLSLRERLQLECHVVTLDHQLRGQAGAEDAEYVEQFCRTHNVSCTRGQADVQAVSRANKVSIEEAARIARYQFIAQVAEQHHIQIVATGHHAGDQAETVLLHLLAGTGAKGLKGMSIKGNVPYAPHLTLIRPLLSISRSTIEDYCRFHDLTPREDATNQDTDYLRNRIRHELTPVLQTYNPQIEVTLNRLAEAMHVDEAYMSAQMDEKLTPYEMFQEGRLQISRQVFRACHPALQRRWLMQGVQRLGVYHRLDVRDFSYERVLAVTHGLNTGETGKKYNLIENLFAVITREWIVLEPILIIF